jgi:FHA domain
MLGGMDIRGGTRDTRWVSAFGRSRLRLAGVLNSAFAEGLLSEQTHVHRLGLLFGTQLIDEQQLIGDLTLRRARSGPLDVARHAWRGLLTSARSVVGFGQPAKLPMLLVLDRAEDDRLLIGRHPACDVVVADPSVSRRHAQLTFRDGVWVLQDLASTNGTAVNGERVGRAALHSGDLVELGAQPFQIE